MKKIFEKQTVWTWILCGSFLALLIGFILFIVNSTTGYLAGKTVAVLPLILSIIALLDILFIFFFGDKVEKFTGFFVFAAAVLIAVSFAAICWSRESIVADVGGFIPGITRPQAEYATWHGSIVVLVFYGISFVCAAISSFGGPFFKKEEKAA